MTIVCQTVLTQINYSAKIQAAIILVSQTKHP